MACNTRICKGCGSELDVSSFRVVRRKKRSWAGGKAHFVTPVQYVEERQWKCPPCESKATMAAARINPQPRRDAVKRYAQRNPLWAAEMHRKHRARHPERHRAMEGTRRALKRAQRCSCCSLAQLGEFYAGRPIGYHVDHVIPLSRGGAHCLLNLQYLPAFENISKHNRLPGGMTP